MTVLVCLKNPLGRDDRAALAAAAAMAPTGGALLALTAGGPSDDEALRPAMAAGAIRAVRADAPADADAGSLGRVLAAAIRRLGAGFVLCGTCAGEEGTGSVPAAIAEQIGAVYLAQAEAVSLLGDGRLAVALRAGGRRLRLAVSPPAVVSVCGAGLALPALPTAAESVAVEVLGLADLGLDAGLVRRSDALLGAREPAERPQVRVGSATELLAALGA
jgi:electron transfer flavoprotein beta subunit